MGKIGINYMATKTRTIPDSYADKFKTTKGRKSLIQEFGNGPAIYCGENEDDETCLVTMFPDGMKITVFQSNGWIRKDTYDADGFKIDEEFDGKWK